MKRGRCQFGLLTFFLSMLLVPDSVYSRRYPIFTSKRLGNAGSPRLPALVPFIFPVPDLPADFELTDYDDNYIPYGEIDDEIEYYPLSPVYGYAGYQTGGDSFIDFGEADDPFGRDIWYNDEGDKDENMDFMRNVVISETNQEPRERDDESEIVYGKPVLSAPDNGQREREQGNYYYGVPVYEEKERTRRRKDDSLRELGVLTRNVEGEGDDVPTDVELVPYHEDGAYWDQWQKRMSRSGRKNSIPLQKDLKMSQKRFYAPTYAELVPYYEDDEAYWDQWQKRMSRSGRKNSIPLQKDLKVSQKRFYAPEKSSFKTEAIQNSNGKAMEANGKTKIEATTSAPQPKTTPTGQKEYVLYRPASPVRKPVKKGVYNGNGKKTDVYDAIKKLIAMEGGVQKEKRPRIQKRFVLSEDQLTSQLNGLKRISV